MSFLEKFGFNSDDINELESIVPEKIQTLIMENNKLVSVNVLYLKELGIQNYKEVFTKFYDMFLLDASVFKGIFDKYDRTSLISKISKKVNIVEYL